MERGGLVAPKLSESPLPDAKGELQALAKELGISRHDQDEWALTSHQRAAKATKDGRLAKEIVPALVPPKFEQPVESDTDIRADSSTEKLGALKPVFDKRYGTVTAGTSSRTRTVLVFDGSASATEPRSSPGRAISFWSAVSIF